MGRFRFRGNTKELVRRLMCYWTKWTKWTKFKNYRNYSKFSLRKLRTKFGRNTDKIQENGIKVRKSEKNAVILNFVQLCPNCVPKLND